MTTKTPLGLAKDTIPVPLPDFKKSKEKRLSSLFNTPFTFNNPFNNPKNLVTMKTFYYLSFLTFLTFLSFPLLAQNQQSVDSQIEAMVSNWNNHNVEKITSHFATDGVRYLNGIPVADGSAAYEAYLQDLFTTYPKLKINPEKWTQSGKTIVLQYTLSGVTKSNKAFSGITIVTMNDDNKVVKEEAYSDNLAIMQDLGFAISPPRDFKYKIGVNEAANLALASKFYESLFENPNRISDIVSQDFMSYGPAVQDSANTTQLIKTYTQVNSIRSNQTNTIQAMIAIDGTDDGPTNGEWVSAWGVYQGTNKSDGKKHLIPWNGLLKIEKGKIVLSQSYFADSSYRTAPSAASKK